MQQYIPHTASTEKQRDLGRGNWKHLKDLFITPSRLFSYFGLEGYLGLIISR